MSTLKRDQTLESLIEGLDQRGLLVLQVLIGQQAMKLLSETHIPKVTGILNAKTIRSNEGQIQIPRDVG